MKPNSNPLACFVSWLLDLVEACVLRLVPWLFRRGRHAWFWLIEHGPNLKQRAIDWCHQARNACRYEELKSRYEHARTWAVLHDTAPVDETAKRRDAWMERQYRHEQREAERQRRNEEVARVREKKEEENRQAHSIYFE